MDEEKEKVPYETLVNPNFTRTLNVKVLLFRVS